MAKPTPHTPKKLADTAQGLTLEQSTRPLLLDLRQLIDQARSYVATAADSTATMLYWHVGQKVRHETLQQARAAYGGKIVATLSRQLVLTHGAGYGEKNLRRMIQFAELFPDAEIVATLSRQLNWSKFRELLALKAPLEREFYAEMCRIERWSVRTLSARIDSMLYERTALSRQPDKLIAHELDTLREIVAAEAVNQFAGGQVGLGRDKAGAAG